jgi:hypothetical protein
MRPPGIEVGDVLVQDAVQVAPADDEQVIQTFGSGRSDPALRERVRPQRSHGGPDPFDAEPLHATIELDPEPAVPVTDQIPRWVPIPAASVHDLLGCPVGGGMSGHPNLQDLPGLVVHYEEDVKRLEEYRANAEEVARPDVRGMSRQELPPAG